jgi:hypothetical protein
MAAASAGSLTTTASAFVTRGTLVDGPSRFCLRVACRFLGIPSDP